jgi:hypothetical protein
MAVMEGSRARAGEHAVEGPGPYAVRFEAAAVQLETRGAARRLRVRAGGTGAGRVRVDDGSPRAVAGDDEGYLPVDVPAGEHRVTIFMTD